MFSAQRPQRAAAHSRRAIVVFLAIYVALAGSGCAQLPTEVDRPPSAALAAPASTPLAQLVQQRHAAAKASFDSGFVLLDGPQAAYSSRLALVKGAQKTLDLQYYAIHTDDSTRHLMRGLREAAARGVRVRILVDDFHSAGRDALVLELAFVPNIQVRLFNPLAGARDSTLARLLNSIVDAARLQQRMHNKLFLADNVLGVTGGRNLGDAYFGNDQTGNFVDLDILAAGPIVQDLSRSFDAYWNNPRAYPVQSLMKRAELDAIREKVAAEHEREAKAAVENGPAIDQSIGTGASTKPPASVLSQQPLDLRSVAFVWAPSVMLADRPGKIAANPDDVDSASASDGAVKTKTETDAPGMIVTQPVESQRQNALAARPVSSAAGTGRAARLASLEAAADAMAGNETVVLGLLQLIGQAQHDLLIISPYFVPGIDITRALTEARQRGVRVRVLTNSLASNDAPVAHVGYARHREELLRLGIELYELRSEQGSLGHPLGSSGQSVTGASRAMLHSKALVIDGRLLVIGSMNLDLRSQLQNTEIALLIASTALSRIATDLIDITLRKGAWRVALAEDGQLVWRAPPEASGLEDTRTEPDTSAWLRWMLKLIAPLTPDSLL